jgi:hypothetical protein
MAITLRFDPKIIKLIKRGVVKKRTWKYTYLCMIIISVTFSELDIGGNQFRIETLRFTDIYNEKNDASSSVIGIHCPEK